MEKKTVSQRKRLAAIFASFAVLIMGTASLVESMSIDYYSVSNTLLKIIPASIALGGIGWLMGMILDKPKKKTKVSPDYSNLLMQNAVKNDIATTIAETEDISINKESES